MNEQRFRILEIRALYEIGIPTAFFWGTLLMQIVLHSAWRLSVGFVGIDVRRYNTILAIGFTLVWLIALLWTQTEVVLSPKGLRLETLKQLQWELPWVQLAAWAWDWHWTGVPQGVILITKAGTTTHRLRLGFIGLGRRVGKVVVPYLPYVPLLKALGYYLQGEQWQEPPPKDIQIKFL